MQNLTATAHRYEFAHMLRGLAALIVVLGAHLMGVFWINTPAACGLLGVSDYKELITLPETVSYLQSFTWFSYGGFGVALFFLISGFVIPFSLIQLRPREFLIARFFRIYPTYWAAFFCSMLVLFHFRQRWPGFEQILYHLGLVRDLAWIPSLDGVSWTLEVEVKFYLVCALISGSIMSGRIVVMFFVLLFAGGLSIILAGTHMGVGLDVGTWAIGSPWYGFTHGMGMSLLFILYMFLGTCFNWHSRELISARWLLILSSVGFIWFAIVWSQSDVKSQVMNGVLNYFFALITFSMTYLFRNKIRVPKLLNRVADISYPLYAVHPVVGYGMLYWLVVLHHMYAWLAIILTIAVTFTLATILHRLVELPSHAFGKKLAKGMNMRVNRETLIPC